MTTESSVDREKRLNPKRNVAVIGLLNSSNEILLVRTKRLPEKWQPIGGGVKPYDKTPIDTLIREVNEEISITLNMDDIKFEIECPYDFGEGTVYFHSAKIDTKSKLLFDEEEIAEWKWFKLTMIDNIETFPATKTFLDHMKSSLASE